MVMSTRNKRRKETCLQQGTNSAAVQDYPVTAARVVAEKNGPLRGLVGMAPPNHFRGPYQQVGHSQPQNPIESDRTC